MKFNKLLKNQIKKALSEDLLENEAVLKLLNVVNDTYNNYDSQFNILENTFKINEEDYSELNKKLQESYQNLNDNVNNKLFDVEQLILTFSNLDNVDSLINNIKNQVDRIAENDSFALYLFNEEENKLKLLFAKDFSELDYQIAENTAMDRHPGFVFSTGQTLFVNDQKNDPNPISVDFKNNQNTSSRMYVPVKSGEKIIGTFGLQSSKKGAFSQTQLALLKVFTALAGNAYINIIKNKLIEKQNKENSILSILAKSTSNNIIYTDHLGKITWVNKPFEKSTGYKLEEIIGKKPGSFLCGKDTEPEMSAKLRNAINNEAECSVVITNYNKEGKPYVSSIQISPVFNEKGELINYVSIQQDVTEIENQKKINEQNVLKIIQSEENYSNILNTTTDIIITTDGKGTITFCNKSWQNKLDQTNAIGKNISNYFHPNSQSKLSDILNQISSFKPSVKSVQFSLKGNDGLKLDLEGQVHCKYKNNQLLENNFFLKDVTQLNLIKENAIQKEKQIELFNSTLIELTSTNFNEYKNIQEVAKVICKKVSICIGADYVYIGKNDSESIININTYNRNTNKDYIGLDFKKNAYPDYVKLLDKKLYFFLNHIDKSNIVPQSILEEFSSVKSALNIPIKINNNLWGIIGFAFNSSFHWQNELISFCKSVGDIFGAIAATFYIKDNKQKLENVLDSLNETIWGLKLPEFKLEYISSSALVLYEYPLEDWFKNVSLWSDMIHPEDKEEALKKSDLLYVNDVIEQDYRIITGNNKVKWISSVTRIIRDKQGIPILMTGMSKDITAIKESQLELLNYKQAINESAIVSTTDLKGNITFVNDKFCQISGYTQEELIGSNHSIVNSGYHAKDFFKTMWKTISKGKIWRGEIKNRAKNGNEYYVDTNIIPFIQNGKPISYISIRYECTDRVNAREVLKQQKDFYEAILDNIPVDIAVFDLNHSYKYLNREAIKDDTVRKYMIGRDDFDYAQLKGLDTKFAEERRKNFNQVINSLIPISWIDAQVKESKTLYKERRFFVDKKSNSVIGYGVDITDLKQKENLLLNSVEEKEALLGEIHHRVKNNLALVVGLIEMEVFASNDQNLIVHLREILRKINAIGLIHEKLYKSNDFSSIDMPGYIRDFVSLSLNLYQNTSVPNFNYFFDEIALNATRAIPLALCINELLTNSYKHAFKNNAAPAISIALKKEEDFIIFKYSDNGKGLDNNLNITELNSLGFKLIIIFIKQLKATYEINTESGFSITLKFTS